MKNVLMIVLLVGIIFVVGCSSPDVVKETPEGNGGVIESAVIARSFSASNVSVGDNLVVTLTKKLDASQTSVLVEENFPSEWTIVDAGTGTVVGNTIRWAELTGAVSGTYTYTLAVAGSPGTVTWMGQYSVNGQEPADIGGLASVVVN